MKELQEHVESITKTMTTSPVFEIADLLVTCFSGGHKLLICGNGGSAADAQHMAAEFVGGYRGKYKPLPAIALTTDSSILTSIGNDAAFDEIFSHQVKALGQTGDVLLAISTSGNSVNVLKALDIARQLGLTTIGFLSERGIPLMGAVCDVFLAVPSENTARIQEVHEFAMHVICEQVEERLINV